MVSKIFEKLVNNRLLITLRNVAFFPIFSMVSAFLDQLQVLRQLYLLELLGLLISLELLELWHLSYPKLLTGCGMLLFFTISGICPYLSNRWLRKVMNGKCSEEFPVSAGVPRDYILGSTLFLIYIDDLPDDVISNIDIYADVTTLYSKCD